MAEQSQSFTYHSLHRHVQSILPQEENKDYPSIYSSNKQPHLPSILSKSRQKRSNQKSLKKGISRVSKSKQNLKPKENQEQNKEMQSIKSLPKGTLLNFNIQEVLGNKYHQTKSKDEIIENSPKKNTVNRLRRQEQSPSKSDQKSFMNEYRIITYVPSDYNGQTKHGISSKQENLKTLNLDLWNKENNLNQSNLHTGNHKKNDSEEIHVINSNDQNVLQLNTWRTSEYHDPYYSNNFGSQMNQSDDKLHKDKDYSPFRQKYSVPLALQIHQKTDYSYEIQELKNKIRHLEHQIVQIERQKTYLTKENQTLKSDNSIVIQQNQNKQNKILQLKQNINHLQQQVKYQDNEINQFKERFYNIHENRQNSARPYFSQQYQLEKNQKRQLEDLQLLNAKISKQISQKNLLITQLNKKNRELFERVANQERQIRQQEQVIQHQEEKIALLSQQIQRLNFSLNQQKKQISFKYNYLPIDRVKEQANQTIESEKLKQMTQKYDQLLRDFNHLEKKHIFMKDQLDHLKYLQANTSSSALTYRSITKNQNPPNSNHNQLMNQYEKEIHELQTRLEISERSFSQVQGEFSNLKQNFRALEELYIKQQNDSYEVEQQYNKITQQNNKHKIQLTNMEQISKAKALAWKQENNSLKLMEKEEVILSLKKQLNSLQRTLLQLSDQVKILQKQKQQIYQKYIQEVEKNIQNSRHHKEELSQYISQMQKEQKQKTSLIVIKYQNLITKLDQQNSFQKQYISNIHNIKSRQISKIQETYKKEIDRLTNEKKDCEVRLQNNRKQRQNVFPQSKHANNYMSLPYSQLNRSPTQNNISKVDNSFRSISINQKQFQAFRINLQQDYDHLEYKYKTLAIENQQFADELKEKQRKLIHLMKDVQFYKLQNDNSIRAKLELCQQLEKVNIMANQLKRVNHSFEDQKILLNRQYEQMNKKYLFCMKQNQSLIDQINNLKRSQSDKQILLQDYEHDIRQLRITILEEKQLNQKKIKQLDLLKEQKQTHKSKEEYYKMLSEKAQRQLQLQMQKNSILLLEKQRQQIIPNSSTLKGQSPRKNLLLIEQTSNSIQQKKDRQTQLYRIQIYKDLNKLFNLTSQSFTLEQIIQKNQQQYLRKLFNAIKEDHDKGRELKQLLVAMEETFKNEKIHIKQDYDLVYEKYLKYKSMCQIMEKDIERYKLQLKKKDQNFAAINI